MGMASWRMGMASMLIGMATRLMGMAGRVIWVSCLSIGTPWVLTRSVMS